MLAKSAAVQSFSTAGVSESARWTLSSGMPNSSSVSSSILKKS